MASRPNEVWSCDFLHDRTGYGQRLKILTVVDEYTRECLEIRVEKRMNSLDVMETMDELIRERGAPAHLRSDNGSEFISKKLADWVGRQKASNRRPPAESWPSGGRVCTSRQAWTSFQRASMQPHFWT